MSYQYKTNKNNDTKIISKNLCKYNKSKAQLSQNIIKQLIFHKKSHLTSLFIEYLIWDDFQEFLFKYYSHKKLIKKFLNEFNPQLNINPTLVDPVGRQIIFLNVIKKKILLKKNYYEKTKYKINNSEKKEKLINFLNILPPDISGEKKIFEKKQIFKNTEKKSLKNESETIDNINANSDISMSLDLRINKKYDSKILDKNTAFVLGKNGENDNEIVKVIKFLKPIQSEHIYRTKKLNKLNNNKNFYFEYLHDITRNKNKNVLYSNCNSEHKNKNSKKENNKIINYKNFGLLNTQDNKNKIKSNSLNNNKIKNKDNINNKNIFKIENRQITNIKSQIQTSQNKSKKKSKGKNNKNIILINKFNNNTTSTKTNSNTNENSINNKKNDKLNNAIDIKNKIKKQNSKISDLNVPFSAMIRSKIASNSNSRKNLKENNNKIKKIILEKKVPSNNFSRKEKILDKKNNFISPEVKRKNNLNLKKNNMGNKLFIDNIIYIKKEKSFDSNNSMKISTKNSTSKLSSSNK